MSITLIVSAVCFGLAFSLWRRGPRCPPWRPHDFLLKIERGRLSLRCESCSYESPGWTLDGKFDGGRSVAVRW